jgi:hypothetical protein
VSRYAIIRPLEGMEQMAQSQWTEALKKMGHQVRIHNLRSANVDPRENLPKLVAEILKDTPEIIFVEGAIGFNLPEFYFDRSIQQLPVVAFWYDDPLRPVEWRKAETGYLDALRLSNVHHFVWDGYWREWLSQKYQIRSFPTHLAADPEQFAPRKLLTEYRDHAVFIGTFVSPRHINTMMSSLPALLRKVAEEVSIQIKKSKYGISPYQILSEVTQALPSKLREAFEKFEQSDSNAILQLRSVVWMVGKNEVRERMLRQALKVVPVLILSGNLEKTHANEGEIRSLLNEESSRLVIGDTGGRNLSEVAKLYGYGVIHLQATDPQSIDGGIPFRVFQTTASKRPLFTDKKKELAECYDFGQDLLAFDSDQDLAEKLSVALTDRSKLDDIAEHGYRRFLSEHTWEHRYQNVLRTIQGRE